jgi:hypothetical protein
LPKKVIEQLFDKISQTHSQKAFETALLRDDCCQFKGLVGSGLNFKIVSAFKNLDRTFLMVLDNAEQAAYHLNDLEQLLSSKEVLYFPAKLISLRPLTMPTFYCGPRCSKNSVIPKRKKSLSPTPKLFLKKSFHNRPSSEKHSPLKKATSSAWILSMRPFLNMVLIG